MDKKHIQIEVKTVAASEEEGRRMGLERGTKGLPTPSPVFSFFSRKKTEVY